MTALNPAERLHELLSQFAATANTQKRTSQTWAEVFGVGEEDVEFRLILAAGLISDVGRAVEASANKLQRQAFRHYAPLWARALMTPDHPLHQTPSIGAELVSGEVLAGAASMAAFLEATIPTSQMPTPEQIAELTEQTAELLNSVKASDLPFELKRLLTARLNDVLWALDQIGVSGPEGVAAAVERLAGAVVFSSASVSEEGRGFLAKVFAAAAAAWGLFRVGPEVEKAIESWGAVLHQLPPN